MGFFSPLKYNNVSSVDLTQGDINLTHQFNVDSSTGQFIINLDNVAEFQNEPDISWKDVGADYKLVNESGEIIPIYRNNVVITGKRIITVSGINANTDLWSFWVCQLYFYHHPETKSPLNLKKRNLVLLIV